MRPYMDAYASYHAVATSTYVLHVLRACNYLQLATQLLLTMLTWYCLITYFYMSFYINLSRTLAFM